MSMNIINDSKVTGKNVQTSIIRTTNVTVPTIRGCHHSWFSIMGTIQTTVNKLNKKLNKPHKPVGNSESKPKNETNCCRQMYLTDDGPITALASFPGSGNTWARYLLQQLTGKSHGKKTCINKGGRLARYIKIINIIKSLNILTIVAFTTLYFNIIATVQ